MYLITTGEFISMRCYLFVLLCVLIGKARAAICSERNSRVKHELDGTYSKTESLRRTDNIRSGQSAKLHYYLGYFIIRSDIIRQHIKALTCVVKR